MKTETSAVKKGWKSFLVLSDCYALEITIAFHGLFRLFQISWLDFIGNKTIVRSQKTMLSRSDCAFISGGKNTYGSVHTKDLLFSFEDEKGKGRILGHAENFSDGKQLLFDFTFPFKDTDHSEMNAVGSPVSGRVLLQENEYPLGPAHSFLLVRSGAASPDHLLCCMPSSNQSPHFSLSYHADFPQRNDLTIQGKSVFSSKVSAQAVKNLKDENQKEVYRFFCENGALDVRFHPFCISEIQEKSSAWQFIPSRSYGFFSGNLKDQKTIPIYKQIGFVENFR